MSEWKELRLGKLILTNQDTISKNYPYSKIKYLDTGSITKGRIEKYQIFDLKKAPSRAKRLVKENDIIYSTVRPINRHYGFIQSPPEDLVVSTGFVVITCKEDKIDSKYLYYYLSSDETIEFLHTIAEGSTSAYPSLKPRDIEELEIHIPPNINEQRAIASVLSSLDDKIDLLHLQNKTLEAMAETLFREWFVEGAEEDWEWRQLDEFIEVQRGLSYKGAGLTDAENGVPMHNLNSVFEGGGYKEIGIKYYTGKFKERHKVFPGDVIITNTEQGHEHLLIGYPAIVAGNFGEYGIFSQHIYRLEIKSTFSNFFLFHLLKTHDVHEQIAGATNGSTVNMLSKDGVEWVKFKLPPQSLIANFTKKANAYYEKQELNKNQIRTLENLRDTLLPKLMNGEVRIKMY